MSTSHTIRAHAQELGDKSDKDQGGCQSGRKVVTLNSKSDLPLVYSILHLHFLLLLCKREFTAAALQNKKLFLLFTFFC